MGNKGFLFCFATKKLAKTEQGFIKSDRKCIKFFKLAASLFTQLFLELICRDCDRFSEQTWGSGRLSPFISDSLGICRRVLGQLNISYLKCQHM